MNEVISRGDEEQIGLDQRHIEVPRKIPPKRGFADPEATIDGHDDTRQSPQDWRQRVHDLQIGGKDFGHDEAWRTGLVDASRTVTSCSRRSSRFERELASRTGS